MEILPSLLKAGGIAALAIGVVYLVYREILKFGIIPKLRQWQGFALLCLLAVLIFAIAMTVLNRISPASDQNEQRRIAQSIINNLRDQRFDAVYATFSDLGKAELEPHQIASRWHDIVNKLGDAESISEPILSTYYGRPAYVATYKGKNEDASIFIAFDTHGEVDVLWFSWK